MRPYGQSDPYTIRALKPVYEEAHKALLSLLHQEKHRDAKQFVARFKTGGENMIEVLYYKVIDTSAKREEAKKENTKKFFSKSKGVSNDNKRGSEVFIFSAKYPLKYRATFKNKNGKPAVDKFMIQINGNPVNLSEQVIILDR